MTEVDWLIDQFALVLEDRDAEIAALTEHGRRAPVGPDDVDDDTADDDTADAADDDTAPPDDEEQPRA